MTAIYSLAAFRLVLAWYQIIIGRERLELHYLPQHISRNGNPPFTPFGKKILLEPVDNANAAITDSMCGGS